MRAVLSKLVCVSASLFAALVGGCAGAAEEPAEESSTSLVGTSLETEIRDRWNATPLKYATLFDKSNSTEARFVQAVSAGRASAVKNVDRFPAFKGTMGRFNDAFVGTNALLEGLAPKVIYEQSLDKIGTFSSVGVDFQQATLLTWLDWTPPYFRNTWLSRKGVWGKNSQTWDPINLRYNDDGDLVFLKNEHGVSVLDFGNANVENAIGASAALFAMMLAQALSDAPKLKTGGPLAQYYWATYYYNAGITVGRKALLSRGACNYRKGLVPNPNNNSSAAFNAQQRTATFELVSRQHYKVTLKALEEGC